MSKVILVSQNPLPYHTIGSWTNMYQNYFESGNSKIDIIICEAPKIRFESVTYKIVSNHLLNKINRRFFNIPHRAYIECLVDCLAPDEKYIIQIVDNFGFTKALFEFIKNKPSVRSQLYIQFFYHGYEPFYGNFESRWFFEVVYTRHIKKRFAGLMAKIIKIRNKNHTINK